MPRCLAPEEEKALGIEWAASLDDLLQRSDFVCIECDYNPETHELIGARAGPKYSVILSCNCRFGRAGASSWINWPKRVG